MGKDMRMTFDHLMTMMTGNQCHLPQLMWMLLGYTHYDITSRDGIMVNLCMFAQDCLTLMKFHFENQLKIEFLGPLVWLFWQPSDMSNHSALSVVFTHFLDQSCDDV